MNYEKNKEFVIRYSEDVILDLKPMMIDLIKDSIVEVFCYNVSRLRIYDRDNETYRIFWFGDDNIKQYGKKYTRPQIAYIFFDHVSKTEFDRFCEILKIDFEFIYGWYENFIYSRSPDYGPDNFIYRKDDNCFNKLLENKYKIYFRDEKRRLKNIEKKNRKNNIKTI